MFLAKTFSVGLQCTGNNFLKFEHAEKHYFLQFYATATSKNDCIIHA